MSDTPRTDALIRFEFGPTGHPFPAHALLAMMQLARQLERELAEARAECERYRTALLGVKSYREANPLGGPAKVFDAMADCIRAGDSYEAVLKEYGFVREEDCGLKESE
jgi:hypothetical protein